MTKREWLTIAAEIQARWPQRVLEDETLALWFNDLQAFDAGQVRAAVLALYVEGREWAPNSGIVVNKLAELDDADGDWAEAWALAKRANRKVDMREGMRWLEERSPNAAETVRRLDCGGNQALMIYLTADEGTVRAQFRDAYRGVQRDRQQGVLYETLPSGTGLRRLEGLKRPGFKSIAERAAGGKELTDGGQQKQIEQ